MRFRLTRWMAGNGTVHFADYYSDRTLCGKWLEEPGKGWRRTSIKLGACEICKRRLERIRRMKWDCD